uniref:Glutaredoxin domain-containing protein n=1 Tax=Eutreptiella gymnastica TaxID=73025 RepID=A0A7S4G8N2_9EUGL
MLAAQVRLMALLPNEGFACQNNSRDRSDAFWWLRITTGAVFACALTTAAFQFSANHTNFIATKPLSTPTKTSPLHSRYEARAAEGTSVQRLRHDRLSVPTTKGHAGGTIETLWEPEAVLVPDSAKDGAEPPPLIIVMFYTLKVLAVALMVSVARAWSTIYVSATRAHGPELYGILSRDPLEHSNRSMGAIAMFNSSGETPRTSEARLAAAMESAGSYNVQAMREAIDQLVYTKPVVVFSQEECSASEDCLAVLDEMIGGYDVVDVDSQAEGSALRLELATRTGIGALPLVFVKGTCVGGYEDLQLLQVDGKLLPMLRAAGAEMSAVPDERQEQQRAASKDDVVEQVKAQADAESMRQLKQRIAQNLSDAAVEQEPERVQTRQATTDTSTRRQSFQRRDEIEDIKAQEKLWVSFWTDENFFLFGGLGSVALLLYFVLVVGPPPV